MSRRVRRSHRQPAAGRPAPTQRSPGCPGYRSSAPIPPVGPHPLGSWSASRRTVAPVAAAAQGDVDQGRPTARRRPWRAAPGGQVSCARQQRPEPGAAGDASGLQQQCLHPPESQGLQGRRGPVGGPVALAQLAGESGEHLGGVARSSRSTSGAALAARRPASRTPRRRPAAARYGLGPGRGGIAPPARYRSRPRAEGAPGRPAWSGPQRPHRRSAASGSRLVAGSDAATNHRVPIG
jgi:hypothetical protein